jgi:hypothetical protein
MNGVFTSRRLATTAHEAIVFRCRAGGQMDGIDAKRFPWPLPDSHARGQWSMGQDVRHARRRTV